MQSLCVYTYINNIAHTTLKVNTMTAAMQEHLQIYTHHIMVSNTTEKTHAVRGGGGGDVSLDCRNRATRVTLGSLFRRVSTASLASLSVHSLRSTYFYHNHSTTGWLFFFNKLAHHHATLPCLSANKVGAAHIHLQVIFFQYTIQTKPSTFL